ncbi:hypothetical protein FGG08_004199 [Glutinoglossum americanum]|uniref:2'-phosphotransferase n=1 Tax=Glutinoglossum americanum TaxID=1670608 RepID=A0A9P8I2W7_9PEZI|nr:hypothetical protein FGG08_004199 [Glutinoglossum americanum]
MSSRHRGSGRGDGRGDEKSRVITISKALSWILRHGAQKEGLKLDPAGYANVEKLLAWHKLKSLGVTLEELRVVVAENDKQRFSLIPNPEFNTTSEADEQPTANEDDPLVWRSRASPLPLVSNPSAWLIRANQGHSITLESSSLLSPITRDSLDMPETVLHGTFYGAWPAILDSGGMSRMDRNHMHFAAGVPGQDSGVISGMRADAQILIYVDIRRALDAGLKFWRSDNGVILTEGDGEGMLPIEFFTMVVDRKRGVTLWEDGSVVSDLSEGLKEMSLPRGKGRGPRGRRGRGGKSGDSSSSRSGDKQGIGATNLKE